MLQCYCTGPSWWGCTARLTPALKSQRLWRSCTWRPQSEHVVLGASLPVEFNWTQQLHWGPVRRHCISANVLKDQRYDAAGQMKSRKEQGQSCLAKLPLLWEKNLPNIVPNRDQFCHGVLGQRLTLILVVFFSSKRAELLGEQKGVLALSVRSLHFMLEKNVDMCRGRDHLMFWWFSLGGGKQLVGGVVFFLVGFFSSN